jgi:hypothetical protein
VLSVAPMRIAFLPVALSALALWGCKDAGAPPGPEADCVSACARQSPRCSEHECARGCAFVLDRLVEHESATVLACVASHAAARPAGQDGHEEACGDPVWADCAAAVGVHADGGPPAPPPAQD